MHYLRGEGERAMNEEEFEALKRELKQYGLEVVVNREN